MIIIVGLGNPLPEYKNTRHNLGETAVSCFAETNNFPNFIFKKNLKSLVSKKKIDKEGVILVLPQTFMNQSGKAVKLLIANSKLPIANLWVVHDDSDLPLGKIRIKKNSSSAGHRGVGSIIENLKTKNFIRFRLGINRPKNQPLEKFVLEKFTIKEFKTAKSVIKQSSKAIKFALKTSIEKAMNIYNQNR